MSPDMRDITTRLLLEWCERLDAQHSRSDGDDEDFWLDRHLMGVALFIKRVAAESNDLELLGLAAKIEMGLSEKFERESREWEEYEEGKRAEYEFEQQVREICIRHFKEAKFTVDLSKYREIIDAHRAEIKDSQVLFRLEKYLDEKKHLKEISKEVRSTLCYSRDRPRTLPDLHEVKREFECELNAFYSRADKTVAAWLQKALRERVDPRLPDPQFLETSAPSASDRPSKPEVNSAHPKLIEAGELAIQYEEE